MSLSLWKGRIISSYLKGSIWMKWPLHTQMPEPGTLAKWKTNQASVCSHERMILIFLQLFINWFEGSVSAGSSGPVQVSGDPFTREEPEALHRVKDTYAGHISVAITIPWALLLQNTPPPNLLDSLKIRPTLSKSSQDRQSTWTWVPILPLSSCFWLNKPLTFPGQFHVYETQLMKVCSAIHTRMF